MALRSDEIDALEAELGCPFPADVRNAYLRGNGLRGPTGCWLLFPAKDDETTNIVRMNELKSEDWFPDSMQRFVFVGEDGVGGLIGTSPSAEAILWYPADGVSIHETRGSVTEIWNVVRRLYEEAKDEAERE